FTLCIWAREKIAERIDYTTAAATKHRFRIVAVSGAIVGGEILAALEMIAGQHEAAAFHGDVAYRGEPRVAGIRGWSAVDLNALRVHRGAHQRQVVFPADDGTELAKFGGKDRERGAIAESPDQSLRRSRHYFAMFTEKCAVGSEE